jgi:hypothetical protein
MGIIRMLAKKYNERRLPEKNLLSSIAKIG